MNWFLAKITYQIICGDGQHTPQFDEQLRLIGASNEKEAFSKAKAIGLSEEDTFYNQKQQQVQWVFINISELNQLHLVDGAELYSRITEQDHAGRYIDMIHLKAEEIQTRYSYHSVHQQAVA